MEEDHGNSNNSNSNSNSSITVDTTKWDRSVWLMKCPLVVSKSWQSQAAASSSSSDSPQVAKVIVSVDPLRSDDSSTLQFTMEMGGNDVGNMPKSYSLNMFQDFVPMCVLSETGQETPTRICLSQIMSHYQSYSENTEKEAPKVKSYWAMLEEMVDCFPLTIAEITSIDLLNSFAI
ncbi:hypothetical protein HAX54_038680 [Datura stramonium]|uniref:TFIIF beta subunit N-terminal domain-containing protein n=1 Tax=Datura stramonium TaxID=4076 RepID=A0ABS8VK42_DATST|nr:hypothetical protein [Datura stramonium]